MVDRLPQQSCASSLQWARHAVRRAPPRQQRCRPRRLGPQWPTAPHHRERTIDGVEWLCRPGLSDDPCSADLTSTVVPESGPTTVEHALAATNPAVDCFYVYPTVSEQSGVVANLHIDPSEMAVAQDPGLSLLAGLQGVRTHLPSVDPACTGRPWGHYGLRPCCRLCVSTDRLGGLPGPLQPRARLHPHRPFAGCFDAHQTGAETRLTTTLPCASTWCRPSSWEGM